MSKLPGILLTLAFGLACGAGVWFWKSPANQGSKPVVRDATATIPKPLKEESITTVTLTPEQEAAIAKKASLILTSQSEKMLHIALAPVEIKPTLRTITLGGEVTIPPGRTVLVAAPLSGTLLAPEGGVPTPGRAVKKGQPILKLVPILTPEGRATLGAASLEADGLAKNAQTQRDITRIALDRAKKLFTDKAGSERVVQEAQAAFDTAERSLEAAKARSQLFAKVVGEAEAGALTALPILCPEDGTLRAVSALPGQAVPAGAALFEVIDLDRVWVRVPVYVGEVPLLDITASAKVGNMTMRPGADTLPAQAVPAPPAGNAVAGTIDLWYELDNRVVHYAPGERVGVLLPQKGPTESLTVPWSAVLHDLYGGTWVYEKIGERAYTRRRVEVLYVDGSTAVLKTGPAVGTKVVTAGAIELFGTEAGHSK